MSAIGTCIGVGIIKNFAEFQKLEIVAILWLVGTAVCDVLITGALSFHLVSTVVDLLVSLLTLYHSANIELDSHKPIQSLTKSFAVSFRSFLLHAQSIDHSVVTVSNGLLTAALAIADVTAFLASVSGF